MTNISYKRGARAERELVSLLEDAGFYAVRSAGSHKGDVSACIDGQFWLFSVKYARDIENIPHAEEHRRLGEIRRRYNIEHIRLAIRVPNKGWMFLLPMLINQTRHWMVTDIIPKGRGWTWDDLRKGWLKRCMWTARVEICLDGYYCHSMFTKNNILTKPEGE